MKRPLLTIFGTLAVTFLLAEGALRLAGFSNPPAEAPMLVWNPSEDELMASGKYLYQFDPHALWSPRPGAVIQFGERERIGGPPDLVNEDGFRGPRVPREKTPGVVRIATLGDSSVFGLAVRSEEAWSALLPGLLAEQGVRAEVINAGVEGFTIAQGLERYRHDVRPYRPDVVVAAFGAINEHFPDTISDEQKIHERAQRNQVVRRAKSWARENLKVVQGVQHLISPGASEAFLAAAEQRRREIEFMSPHQNDPAWPFGRRVSAEDFERLFQTLADEVERDGGRLIVMVPPRRAAAEADMPYLIRYTRAAATFAGLRGLQVLNAYSRFRKAHREGEPEPALFIHDYWHPSKFGHQTIASWLAPMIVDPNFLRGGDSQF